MYGGSRVPESWRSPSGSELEVDVAEVGAPEGKKVTRSLLRKAKQCLIPWVIVCLLCMCHDNLISHGIKEGESLVIVSVEHVVCTCNV